MANATDFADIANRIAEVITIAASHDKDITLTNVTPTTDRCILQLHAEKTKSNADIFFDQTNNHLVITMTITIMTVTKTMLLAAFPDTEYNYANANDAIEKVAAVFETLQ